MSSQPSRHGAVHEPILPGISLSNALPPPPTRNTPFARPQHRENGGHALTLTTALAATNAGSQYSTPHSAVTYHSPLSARQPMPVSANPGNTSRGASPMAPRATGRFSVPYDPRDWASGDVGANQALRAREQQAEEGLASPPPPYSPQGIARERRNEVVSRTTGSPETVSQVDTARPLTTTAAITTDTNHRPQSFHPGALNASNRLSLNLGHPIPPPPPVGGNSRSASRTGLTASGMGLGDSATPKAASPDAAMFPPTSRRAVSANAGPYRYEEPGPSSRSSSVQRSWHPGLPLPGPPPGPPPPSARSRSMNSSERSSSQSQKRPRPSRFSLHPTDLGPIPPTPANWTDESFGFSGQQKLSYPIMATAESGQTLIEHDSKMASVNSDALASAPTLTRSPAIRDSSVQGLRERRAQNRNSRFISSDELADLSVDTGRKSSVSDKKSPGTPRTSGGLNSVGRESKLRRNVASPLAGVLAGEHYVTESPQDFNTPPLSSPTQLHSQMQASRSAGLPPKSLPTPPLSHRAPHSAHSAMPPSKEFLPGYVSDDANEFVRNALRRQAEFLEREKAAHSDGERLEIFADYIQQECSIRQQKYASTLQVGSFDVQKFRDNLFKPKKQRETQLTSSGLVPERHNLEPNNNALQRQDSQAWKDFRPALSPIASMDYDEMSSRGRAPSRWWESQTGSQSGGGKAPKVRRSKRESKYMGLSKEFFMTQSPGDEFPAYLEQTGRDSWIGDSFPPEKSDPQTFGIFEEETSQPSPTVHSRTSDAPSLLDISRFITLPPPYPRHHPAVNNNHPDLAVYRTTVRTLSDLSEVQNRKARQKSSSEALQSKHKRKISDSRRMFRSNVQAQIQDGSISFAEAAEAEEAYRETELEMEKACLQADFDTLQDVVVNPLHDLLHERITQLDASLKQLQNDLCTNARHQDPDGPQEEGDETPELLEKLTQLKWLFDTREQIHKECFELLSERNDKFGAIVLLPYRFQNNAEKVRDTEMFFQKDTQNRHATFCDESLRRHEEFLDIIDGHVRRGVELQSSAFWDIAPGLLDILQRIPDNLQQLPGVQIPAQEYAENPSYHDHPQQYLYLLLSHAEKSTYQFIEGQVNLHCLLHEVKTGLLAARYRSLHAHKAASGEHHDINLNTTRLEEEATLTAELKQKASMIEEQWLEALGSQLQGTRDRVMALLQDNDAWEEIAQDAA